MVNKRVKSTGSSEPLLQIPEDEQWRIIQESGVLQQAAVAESNEPQVTPLAEEIANASLLITPFSFLLLLMEM